MDRRGLSNAQKAVLTLAFVPMLATGVAGGIGTYSNVSGAYGDGTALGAVAAGEGATAVLALVLLGLTMLGQSAPAVIRAGLWALPAAASAMAITAAESAGEAVIYAVTPMGMTVAAEGMAFLARRIVVHQDGRDVEAETRSAAVVRSLAYHRARAANHPNARARKASERRSWKLAQKVGDGDDFLAAQLLGVQRDRVQSSADAALQDMFGTAPTLTPARPARPELDVSTDAEESTATPVNRSPVDQREEPLPALPVAPEDGPTPTAATAAAGVESVQKSVAAARSPRSGRATGRVPQSARTTTRPKRTPDQLLDEARSATAEWPDAALTANAIRLAVRTSAASARTLRETLRAERDAGSAVTGARSGDATAGVA